MAEQHHRQEVIPGMEQYSEAPSPMRELVLENRKIAFGRVVMPYFFKLHEEDYRDVTDEMVAAANPNRFLPYLLPGKHSDRGLYVVDGVALDGAEYQRIVRSPAAFAKNISNTTYQARALEPSAENRTDATRRSVAHSLEGENGKIAKMMRTLENIRGEQEIIKKLDKEASHPGFAHERAQDILSWATTVRYTIFERMLEVTGREKRWTAEQADMASRSLDTALFFRSSERVGNWRQSLRAARMYGSQRESLFDRRIQEATRLLGRIATDNR